MQNKTIKTLLINITFCFSLANIIFSFITIIGCSNKTYLQMHNKVKDQTLRHYKESELQIIPFNPLISLQDLKKNKNKFSNYKNKEIENQLKVNKWMNNNPCS